MLHKGRNVILPKTLSVLKELQHDDSLHEFYLVGGTALALQIGHRFSVDLDFSRMSSFDTAEVTEHLFQNYNFQLTAVSKNTVLGVVDGIKVDFMTHAYPLVEPILEEEGMRMSGLLDIAAMKLNAISHSGQRLKDFIDIYFLLETFPLIELLNSYDIKYTNSSSMVALKGIIYFGDLDVEIDPPIMVKTVEIEKVKKRIIQAASSPEKIFDQLE